MGRHHLAGPAAWDATGATHGSALGPSLHRYGSYALDITPRNHALYSHYGLSPCRNNRGVGHENGIVEATHGHLKQRLEQKPILRAAAISRNPLYSASRWPRCSVPQRPSHRRYEQELEHLSAFPAFRIAAYELLTVRVRSASTIEVRQVVYSLLPTLIYRQVTVRLYHDRLIARRQRLLREAHLLWQKGLDGFDHQHLDTQL